MPNEYVKEISDCIIRKRNIQQNCLAYYIILRNYVHINVIPNEIFKPIQSISSTANVFLFQAKSRHGLVVFTPCWIHLTPKTTFPSSLPFPSISPPLGAPSTSISRYSETPQQRTHQKSIQPTIWSSFYFDLQVIGNLKKDRLLSIDIQLLGEGIQLPDLSTHCQLFP